MTENWRYAQPGQADVVIITTFDRETSDASFGAMIAEHPGNGGDLLLKTCACSSTQGALSELLNATSKMVLEATAGKTIKTALERKLMAAQSVRDKTDRKAEQARWAINVIWQQLRSANDPADLRIVSSRPTTYCGPWNVSAVCVGLCGTGETEELALIDLKGKMRSSITAL
ncbi:hypothetical protein D6C77_09941 [Aureobasidium pullulans]|uniref:Uncharacterized protein n=1 Tax=Aureobasidium pullulans TaxID=5580 RepID=A0AB74JYH6_AURPU|nr:hypothetical protein D6D12_03977 [Aureobasidium pullulans]TIA48352.1 hypothetical protein D6C77_09941 [Aureobasidium pullulans]